VSQSRVTEEVTDPTIVRPVVAITGANGYLGTVFATAFESSGFSVRKLVREPSRSGSDRAFVLGVPIEQEALAGVDVLIHCAYDLTWTTRRDIWETNVFGSNALFDLAVSSGVRRTIAVSSMSAYSGTRQVYGRAKLEVETAALSRGMVVVRPGLVYGPGGGGMAGTLRRLTALPLLPDFGDAAHQFTVHEDDLASAVIALALTDSLATQPVGIAHADPVQFRTLLSEFAAGNNNAGNKDLDLRFLPTPSMAVYAALRIAEFLHLSLPVRADSLLGLVRPAPRVPCLEALEVLGVTLRPFPEGVGATIPSSAGGGPSGPMIV
jgi:nucleoside-diphosphate-sugar epimerase